MVALARSTFMYKLSCPVLKFQPKYQKAGCRKCVHFKILFVSVYNLNIFIFPTNHTDKKPSINACRHMGFVYLLLCGLELAATENVLWFARKRNCLVTRRTPAGFI